VHQSRYLALYFINRLRYFGLLVGGFGLKRSPCDYQGLTLPAGFGQSNPSVAETFAICYWLSAISY